MINQLSIKNFKSIKELNFNPKKINIFIGAPNVGKSNILEALSLFSIPYISNFDNKFDGLVRFNNLKNLFFDNITLKKVEVITNIAIAQLRYRDNIDMFDLFIGKKTLNDSDLKLNPDYSNLTNTLNNTYRKYPDLLESEKIK
ncbi:MAG: hypothetical protein DRI94_13290, partial [Bacteroidetes bacterium]